MMTMFERVQRFMVLTKQYGGRVFIGDRAAPGFQKDEAEIRLRAEMIYEETMEFLEACGLGVRIGAGPGESPLYRIGKPPDFILAIDALCDLLYVVLGAFVNFGLNPEPFFEEVDSNNLSKLGPDRVIREDGRVMKPPSYSPPDLARVLEVETTRNMDKGDGR